MAKAELKPLTPQLLGLVARKVAQISVKRDIPLDEALEVYSGELSKTMKKYDVDASGDEIVEKAEGKLNSLSISQPKTVVKSKTKPKTKPKIKAEPTKRLADPLMIKVKGEVELIKTEMGTIVKRTAKTKKVALKCPEGTHGEKLDEDRAGCVFD